MKSSIRLSPTFSSIDSDELSADKLDLWMCLVCSLFLNTISEGINSFDLVAFLA